jgi:branched-chain amino acid transport system permease protein
MEYFFDLVVIGLSTGMIYALVALGLSFIYSGLDMLHFAHGEIYMLGAFAGFIAVDSFGLDYPLAIATAMLLTAAFGIVLERLVYRRLTAKGGGLSVAGMGMIIIGFGMSILLQNAAFLIWGPAAKSFPVDFGMPIELRGIALPRSYIWIVVMAVVLMGALHAVLTRTQFGRAMRAVAYNKDRAALMGVNVSFTMSAIFGIGCAMAAAGGVLIAPLNDVSFSMGFIIMMKIFAAAVIGGLGSLPGAVVGGLLIGLIESLGAGYISAAYKDIYAFLVLIAFLMIRPSGVFGVVARVKA